MSQFESESIELAETLMTSIESNGKKKSTNKEPRQEIYNLLLTHVSQLDLISISIRKVISDVCFLVKSTNLLESQGQGQVNSGLSSMSVNSHRHAVLALFFAVYHVVVNGFPKLRKKLEGGSHRILSPPAYLEFLQGWVPTLATVVLLVVDFGGEVGGEGMMKMGGKHSPGVKNALEYLKGVEGIDQSMVVKWILRFEEQEGGGCCLPAPVAAVATANATTPAMAMVTVAAVAISPVSATSETDIDVASTTSSSKCEEINMWELGKPVSQINEHVSRLFRNCNNVLEESTTPTPTPTAATTTATTTTPIWNLRLDGCTLLQRIIAIFHPSKRTEFTAFYFVHHLVEFCSFDQSELAAAVLACFFLSCKCTDETEITLRVLLASPKLRALELPRCTNISSSGTIQPNTYGNNAGNFNDKLIKVSEWKWKLAAKKNFTASNNTIQFNSFRLTSSSSSIAFPSTSMCRIFPRSCISTRTKKPPNQTSTE